MKPKDVIEQLIGPVVEWGQLDTLAFVVYAPTYKDKKYDFANINLDKGTVEFCMSTPDGEPGIALQLAIHATLEPCE